jgi:hypothetical protein
MSISRLLGFTVGQQLHRTLQVGEEHGDLLPSPSRAALEVMIFSARCLGV